MQKNELFPVGCITRLRADVPWEDLKGAQVEILEHNAEIKKDAWKSENCRRCFFVDEKMLARALRRWTGANGVDDISVTFNMSYLDRNYIIDAVDNTAIDEMFE